MRQGNKESEVKDDRDRASFSSHLMLSFMMVLQSSFLSLPYESAMIDGISIVVTVVYYILKIQTANTEENIERSQFKYKYD